jgi:hypothetical protein
VVPRRGQGIDDRGRVGETVTVVQLGVVELDREQLGDAGVEAHEPLAGVGHRAVVERAGVMLERRRLAWAAGAPCRPVRLEDVRSCQPIAGAVADTALVFAIVRLA